MKPSLVLHESETIEKNAVSLKEPRAKNKKKQFLFSMILLLTAALVTGFFVVRFFAGHGIIDAPVTSEDVPRDMPDWVTPALLPRGGESRSGVKIEEVHDLVVHYVGNPQTSAMANRNYFAMETTETSAHFIVGLDGEILQCLPLAEKSSATGNRNFDTISIEVCHPDESGRFSPKTRASLVRLLAYLCDKYRLTQDHIIRHYDVTGKMCPLYYVQNPAEWDALRNDVAAFQISSKFGS